MFNPTAVVIDAFVDELRKGYISTYTTLEPDYPGIIDYVGHMALELIANSDAPYHDLGHTICVTLVGQEVLRGKHLREGGVSPATGCTSSSRCCVTTLGTCAASVGTTSKVAT